MSNPEIAKYFLALQPLAHPTLNNANRDNILDRLNECFNGNFAWEVTNECTILDGTVISTTVMVYTPGRLYTGKATLNVKEYAVCHLEAILSACKPLINSKPNTNAAQPPAPSQQPQQTSTSGNMTPDQIMAAVSGQPQPPASQPQQQQQQQSNPNSDLPFYFGPNDPNAPEDVREKAQASLPPQYRGKPLEYYEPNPKINGYSQCQFERMIAFKKEWGIVNDGMMTNYIHMWKPSLPNPTFDAVITPQNIDEFLAWGESLEKTCC